MNVDVKYAADLRKQILAVLNENFSNLHEIVTKCHGAYPVLVKSILDELVREGSIYVENECYMMSGLVHNYDTNKNAIKGSQIVIDDDSITHPAEYDWRFSKASIDRIISDYTEKLSPNSKIALLGTTSLYAGFANRGFETFLFNKSEFLIDELIKKNFNKGLIVHDLFNPLPSHYNNYFDLVIADPPWYLDYYYSFMLRATEILKHNGKMLLSVFPDMTRPSAKKELEVLKAYIDELGFSIESMLPAYFTYLTPNFESKALLAEGINFSDSWRNGDLYQLIKDNLSQVNKIGDRTSRDTEEWYEFLLPPKKRIKIRKRFEVPNTNFSYSFIGDGMVLKNVSRRDPNRNNIDLWTSDNEVVSVKGIHLLKEALLLIQHGTHIDATIELLKRKYINQKGFGELEDLLRKL